MCIELEEVSGQVLSAMTQWGLASYDAAHAATAIYVQADAIVTTDAGFGSVPEAALCIYTDSSRLRRCRRRRGGAMSARDSGGSQQRDTLGSHALYAWGARLSRVIGNPWLTGRMDSGAHGISVGWSQAAMQGPRLSSQISASWPD